MQKWFSPGVYARLLHAASGQPRRLRGGIVRRLGPVSAVCVVTVLAFLLPPPLAPIETIRAQPGLAQIGYRGPGYASSRFATATGEKPESKLWWNDGVWWGDLFHEPSGTHHIHRLDAASMTWEDNGVQLDDRKKSKSDILWDEPSEKLYVVSHKGSDASERAEPEDQGRLYRYSYVRESRTYLLDPGFPVSVTPGLTQSLTIAKDSTGRLWITYVWGATVVISHSDGDDATWVEPFPLPVQVPQTSAEDLSAVLAFGGDKIGVAWGDQVMDTVHFAVHHDTAPATEWTEEIIVDGDRMADNHLNLTTDRRGAVYLVTKTSAKRLFDPLIFLHVRTSDGVWSSHEFGARLDRHTRPIVLVDDDNDDVYVFATAPEGGGGIYVKRARVDAIVFEPGPGTPILRYPGALGLNDVTSTKQAVNGMTGLVILASDGTTQTYYYNLLPLHQVDHEALP